MNSTALKFDAWLHWNVYEKCNLDCSYCFTNLNRDGLSIRGTTPPTPEALLTRAWKKAKRIVAAVASSPSPPKAARPKKETPNRIDIKRVMRTLEETKMRFQIVITGSGEPFMILNLVELCEAVTKKHYVGLHTNLISKNMVRFAKKISPDRVTYINASCHIKELERTQNIDRYVENYLICKERGFKIKAKAVGHPSLLPEVDYYRNQFSQEGVDLKFGPFIGYFEGKQYPHSYTDNERELLGLNNDPEQDRDVYFQKGKPCNAGYNVAKVDPNGQVYACTAVKTPLGNIYEKFQFNKSIMVCPAAFCGCPVSQYNEALFKAALKAS